MTDLQSIGGRRKLIDLRRQLSDRLAALHAVVPAAVDGLTADHSGALKAESQARFSAVRSRITLHQGKWPAVLLDEGLDEYRESARLVWSSTDEFLHWLDNLVHHDRARIH